MMYSVQFSINEMNKRLQYICLDRYVGCPGDNNLVTIYVIFSYIRYFQYGPWWYFDDESGGVKAWKSRPDVFPDGFRLVAYMHVYS